MSLKNLLLRRRGLGCIPCIPDDRDHDFDRLGLSAVGLPDSCNNWADMVRGIRDQGPANSCTGNAMAGMVDAIICRSGYRNVLAPAAVQPIYRLARGGYASKVSDRGASVRGVMDTVRHFGWSDEAYAPYSASASVINRYPSPAAITNGLSRAGANYAWIQDDGLARVTPLKAALASQNPVGMRVYVTTPWRGNSGPSTFDADVLEQDGLGWHMVWLLDYDEIGCRMINSWGPQWRGGWVRLTWEFLAHPTCGDFATLYNVAALVDRAAQAALSLEVSHARD